MRTLPVAFFLLGVLAVSAEAALDPAAIPSPRSSGWVIDQAQVLAPDEIAALTRLGEAVHARDGAEMAVVIVPTIGGGNHRESATRLFNHWGLGDRVRNNGLLIFVAVGDRAAEIVLGDRLADQAGVAKGDRVMQGEMVPRFRRGENAAAVVAGARACARDFFGVVLTEQAPDPAVTSVESATDLERPPPAGDSSNRSRRSVGVGLAATGGVGGVGLAAWLGARAWLRRRPRRCRSCSMTMGLLDEAADDAHLAAGEQAEERVGSVNYDVWHCPGCGVVEKVRFGRWFTRYSRCGQCGAQTRNTSNTTLASATTFSTGLVEIREHCEHCGASKTYTRTTPRLAASTSTGTRSSGSGGGRSSGRGSSGRW